jgi:hypothetical protein
MTTIIETLINAGGKEWISGEMHRIYFNASVVNEIAGFTFKGKDTFQDGEIISRNQAFKKTMSNGTNVKFYYDVTTGKFCSSLVARETLEKVAGVLRGMMAKASTKKDKKAVMTRAWVIAKEAAAKFGGKASQYLSGALKAAWAE